jgi:hypothetical protein
MPTLRRWKAVLILAGAAAWGAFPAAGARAQTPGHPDCLEQLACMSWEELERLYRDSGPGAIPVGYARGRAIYCPGARLSGVKSGVANALWHGKHFAADGGTLVNQWCGFKAIRAQVCYGPSWLDGSPSIIMDYGHTSHVWSDVRDEIREVAPGLYVGVMFLRHDPQPRLKMFFALDCRPSCAACGS